MKIALKKIMAVVLSLSLAIGAVNVFAPKQTIKTAMARQKTVYDEIKLSKLPKRTLESVKTTALEDGAKAAKEVNSYSDKADYDAALNAALTSYYKNNDKKKLKSFTKNLDKRAKTIVDNYEKAYKERKKGSKIFVVGKVMAMTDADVSKKEMQDVCKAENAKLVNYYAIHTGEHIAEIDISLGQTVDMASKKFSNYSFVVAADSNDIAEPCEEVANVENLSPEISNETANLTNDNYDDGSYHFDNMYVKGAWDYLQTHNHRKVKVAVIDVGCYSRNTDLKNIITSDSYDVVEDKPVTEITYPDDAYHGSAVAGTIAAESNNGNQISGVASGYDNSIVDILAIPAATPADTVKKYSFQNKYLYEAYDYAIDHGAEVINMSYSSTSENYVSTEYMKRMYDLGIVLVAAGGNDGNLDKHYPADTPYVISVGATDSANSISYFSSYGYFKTICAPGYKINCIETEADTYLPMNGTSFASPCTSAVAAMMKSVNKDLGTYEVARIMQNTDTKVPDINTVNKFDNHGVVNAEKCVKTAADYTETTFFGGEEEGLINVADKAEITASNNVGSTPVSNMNDKSIDTSTTLGSGTSQSIVLKLDKEYDIERVRVMVANQISGLSAYYSNNGQDYTYFSTTTSWVWYEQKTFPVTHERVGSHTAKYIKLVYTDVADIEIKEIQIWANGTYTRPNDDCNMTPYTAEPVNLEAQVTGYHKVKLTWEKTDYIKNRDYDYSIYCNGRKIGTSNGTSYVDEDAIDSYGLLYYEVMATYKGVDSARVTWNLYVNWEDYLETTTEAPNVNLALGKSAVASSEENGGVTASKAIDGDAGTRWSSAFTDNEWIYVDLQGEYDVSKVEINWETARASAYKIETSLDGNNWTEVATNTQNIANTTDTFAPVKARYVKMKGVSRNTGYGYSIFEMRVFGGNSVQTTAAPTTTVAPTTLAPTTTVESTSAPETTTKRTRRIIPGGYTVSTENIAAGKTAIASSEENDGVNANKVCDGDMGTRWSSQWTDDEWIVVDLGEVLPIAQVKLHWEAAYGKDYVLQFSEDGETYYDKRTTTNNTLRDTIEGFPAEYTRYIRVKCSKRGTGYGYSLYEIEAFPAIINAATTVAPTTTNAPTTTAMELTNLALGASGSASSSENDAMGALKAFDGDMNTRWASAWEDNQSIRIHLGGQKYISHIVINWEAAYAKSYDIQTTYNGKNWTTVQSITNSDGGIDTVQLNTSATDIRIMCNTRATGYGFSIYEIAVMGY